MKLLEIPIYFRTRDAARSEQYWRSYDYNEIIGWVVLETRPRAIRAEYWMVLQRPCSGLIRKQFANKGKLFKINVAGLDNTGILSKLKSAFQDVQENSYLFKYHFDLEVLNGIGPHIDWVGIIDA
jgi:hypothetical protein